MVIKMTSKQRAYLRGLANGIDAIFQIGKSGITENQIQQLKDALKAAYIYEEILGSDHCPVGIDIF